jgi:hypothetical protein
VALSRSANRLTFRARVFLAHVLRATNGTFGLLAVNGAFGTCRLLALHLAFGTRANGVTNGRARRVVTLPAADRVAVLAAWLFVRVYFRIHLRLGRGIGLGFNLGLCVNFCCDLHFGLCGYCHRRNRKQC